MIATGVYFAHLEKTLDMLDDIASDINISKHLHLTFLIFITNSPNSIMSPTGLLLACDVIHPDLKSCESKIVILKERLNFLNMYFTFSK